MPEPTSPGSRTRESLSTRVARALVPHARRAQVKALYSRTTWRLYAGTDVRCNCCEGRFRRFRTYSSGGDHRALACPRCASLGRHRVDWLYLTERVDVLGRPTRLLHIAPEVCLEAPLRKLSNVDYLSADFDSTLAMDRVDLRDIQYADASFDAVICNHVLQLIDDDATAMSELCRIVKPGGWGLIQSSVDDALDDTMERPEAPSGFDPSGHYEEVFQRKYGRHDYVRRLEQAGFEVTVSDFARDLQPSIVRELGLDLDETIYFCQRP
jgi:SAM-dependent methyltransferase